MLIRSLYLILRLSQVFGDIFDSVQGLLSPMDIFWPDDWQPSVVVLSSNHAGEKVDITLHCHINTEVPKGSYIEITIIGFETKKYSVVSEETFPLEGDNKLVFKDVILPDTPGTYGPVSVLVRYESEKGQIIAASNSLTYFAIVEKKPEKIANLTVVYADDASKVILETTTLTFSFLITTTLYLYDYFVLTIDQAYSFENINEGPIWDTADESYDYFKNVKMKFDSEKKQLVFYGLDQEVNSGEFFKVSVANVVNPSSVVLNGYWEMEIYRFGVPTLKQHVYAKDDLQLSVAGKLSKVVWDIDKKYLDKNPLFVNTLNYMVLNFTLSHGVAEGGKIIVVFSDSVDIRKYSYVTNVTDQSIELIDDDHPEYLYFEPYTQISCQIDSVVSVSCTVKKFLSRDDIISIYNLVYFSGDQPGVISITTMDANDYIIDKLSSSLYLSYESNANYIYMKSNPTLYITADKSSLYKVGFSGSGAILISFQAEGYINPLQESITIGIPLVSSASNYFSSLYFKSLLNCYYSQTNSSVSGPYSRSLKYQVSTNKLILIIPQDITINAYDWVNILIESSEGVLNTPLFPSSQRFRYEVSLMYRSINLYYFYRKPLYFTTTEVDIDLQLFCTSSPGVNLPAQLTLIPSFSWIPNRNYKVYIYFLIENSEWTQSSWFINSGLGSQYPSDSNDVELIEGSSESGDSIYLKYQVSELEPLVTSENRTIIVPFPIGVANSSIKITGKIYSVVQSSQLSQLIATSSVKTVKYASKFTSTEGITFIETSSTGSEESSFTLTSTSKLSYYSLGFTQGFNLTEISENLVLLSGYYVNSSTSGLFTVDLVSSKSDTVEGLINTWLDADTFVHITIADSIFSNSECVGYSEKELSITNNNIEVSSEINPNSSTGLGASSFYQDFKVSFQVPGFFQGSNSSNLSFSLDTRVTSFVYTVSYSSLSHTGSGTNTATISITKDLAKGEILILEFEIKLFKVTSPGEDVDLITDVSLIYNEKTIYSLSEVISVYFDSGLSYDTSNDMIYSVFPNVYNAKDAYFFMSFSANMSLPKNTTIIISGRKFKDDSTPQNDVWCTLGASYAYVSDGILYFRTLLPYTIGELIQIIKDVAFDNPESSDVKVQFKVKAIYNDFVLVSDEKQSNAVLKFNESPSDSVYMGSLEVSIENMGFESWHSFTFKSSTDTSENTVFIFDVPGGYTAHAGVVFSYNELPFVYFLNSYSSVSKITCTAEHWLIVCAGMDIVSANTVIDISLLLVNPSKTKVYWELYVADVGLDNGLTINSMPTSSMSAEFSSIPGYKIDILTVNYENNLDQSVNLTILADSYDNFYSGDMVIVEFPRPYEVSIYNPVQILCSKSCRGQMNPSKEYCVVQENGVVFSLRSDFYCGDTEYVFGFYFVLNPIGQGFIRDEKDEIVTDYLKYDYWSEKFIIFIVKSDNPYKLDSSSIANLNTAYTGFVAGSSALITINDGKPIQLTSGTYSEYIKISMKNDILEANLLKFLATDYNNKKLEFDNEGVYFLTNDLTSNYFRVGIDGDSYDSFFYITWSMQETPIISGLYKYKAPSKTIVQVSGTIKKPIFTEENIIIPMNTRRVLAINFNGLSPFSNMTVKLSFENDCGENLTILVDELIAYEDTTILYTVLESNSSGKECIIQYILDGSSSSAFLPLNDTKIKISGIETENNENSTLFDISGIYGKLGIRAKASAIVYWALLSTKLFISNSTLYDLEYIKNNSEPFYGERDYYKSVSFQLISLEIQIAAVENSNWGTNCLNTLKVADTTMIYGTSYVEKSDSGSQFFYQLGSLIASTNYTLVTYIESMSKIIHFSYENARTADYDLSIPITIKLDQNISIENVIKTVAYSINVNSNRIIEYSVPNNRRLLVSFELLLLPSMRSTIGTMELAKRLTEKVFLSSFNELYPDEKINDVTVSVGTEGIDENYYGTPIFKSFNWNPLKNGMSANFSLNQLADVCCVVSENETDVSGTSITYGYDEYGTDYIWYNCVSVPEGKTRNMTYNSSNYNYPEYFMKCIPCNLYPIIPWCNKDQIKNISWGWESSVSFSLLFQTFKGILIWTLFS